MARKQGGGKGRGGGGGGDLLGSMMAGADAAVADPELVATDEADLASDAAEASQGLSDPPELEADGPEVDEPGVDEPEPEADEPAAGRRVGDSCSVTRDCLGRLGEFTRYHEVKNGERTGWVIVYLRCDLCGERDAGRDSERRLVLVGR